MDNGRITIEATGEEKTPIQTSALIWLDNERAALAKQLPATYETYRRIRRQPTIALARAVTMAPVMAADWSIEVGDDAPDGARELVERDVLPARPVIVQGAMEARVDYGWSAWEKVFEIDDSVGNGRVRLKKLKPLLVDLTEILLDRATGAFAGVRQAPTLQRPQYTIVDAPYAMVINWQVEGANYYGEPLLENIRSAFTDWSDANSGAQRYDRKVAGTHWVVKFPLGTTFLNGVETDNAEVAGAFLEALESSGSIAIPRQIAAFVEDLKNAPEDAWKIDLIDAQPKQGGFIERMRYCDTQFIRGLLSPERAALEGVFGTKAEAGVHADIMLTCREIEHRHITRMVNWHLVDQLLAINWGEAARGTVRLVASPLADERIAFFRSIYQSLLSNPAGFADASGAVDLRAIVQAVGLPVSSDASGAAPDGVDVQNELSGLLSELYQSANGAPAQES